MSQERNRSSQETIVDLDRITEARVPSWRRIVCMSRFGLFFSRSKSSTQESLSISDDHLQTMTEAAIQDIVNWR